MSTDRELLELAAKAAGYTTNHRWNAERITLNPPVDALVVHDANGLVHTAWNPLTDDGAALRLAVDLKLGVTYGGKYFFDDGPMTFCGEYWDANESRYFKAFVKHESDPRAATRRAIVRAAAEIGKAMP